MGIPFVKMNGAGNDFIIFDARHHDIHLSTSHIVTLSSRDNVGCDQLIIIKNSDEADCFMEIYNSDGSLSGACGNATRCVASILMGADRNCVTIKTAADILTCWKDGNLISVDMGVPKFGWEDIPLSRDEKTILLYGFGFKCLNIGNPHAVTFVQEALSDETFFEIGPKVENNALFPEKTNVEFVRQISDDLLEVRVWERGAGETMACGSGGCAVGVLAIKNGLVNGNKVTTRFKGGDLIIQWDGNGSSVIMTGGFERMFEGKMER